MIWGVVYGRRRIGKSCLLSSFSEGKKAVLFQATADGESNLRDLAGEIPPLFPVSSSVVYSSYEDAFDDIAELSKSEKILFVIDEVSFPEESNRDILPIIQKYSDTFLKLILCSSMESFMVERILGGKTSLSGRSSLRLKLRALKPQDTSSFFPSLGTQGSFPGLCHHRRCSVLPLAPCKVQDI